MPQEIVLDKARTLLAPKFPQFDRLEPAFRNAWVDTRHSVVPLDWFDMSHSWSDRNTAYLDGAGLAASDVDVIVTVSTGIATPTLEARAACRMCFRQDVRRVPVFGLGSAGGVSGLSIARSMAAADPKATVLMVAVEACSLSFQMEHLRKADIIATVLFGDGAAAAVLSGGRGDGPILDAGLEYMWPETLDIMGWDVGENGLGVIFDRSIPEFTKTSFRTAADDALHRAGLRIDQIDRFVCHPGGAKVLTALEAAMDLAPETLDHERAVLRRAGNMSAPTALFVLSGALRAGTTGQLMLCALGPGFTASFLPIRA
ncbi:Alpha-pyrone synthesis polyketide synthase-like Pks11 [Rhodobacteraceae bacterium THAF1]|uniref:type III polyketide synthase n=1 Tax=Palleronia sp. THAF1 TaxID=2587842 RepID=UPI000F3CBE08|nr:3-oxoacyl-[acyl-carrier-protein] synthase III C-terminal domain-containing protein [Palleronia sp. THAF1]QFU07443.1 Alpha-pyrone synthesis polyketide synthase-like Pks11 [Palleronia sp. THAF1]VDC20645.1 Alpha-pyrone synthesis polyketide synthase-like Pks11 [Rhodobacteraceae bacterium THAF1]